MNTDDKIKKQFQSKFDDFKVPVPADGWIRLEESLNNASVARKMIVRRRWQYAGSVAAVLILLVGGLFYMNRPITNDQPYMSEVVVLPSVTEEESEVKAQSQTESKIIESPLLADGNALDSVEKTIEAIVEPTDPAAMLVEYLSRTDIAFKSFKEDFLTEAMGYPTEDYFFEEDSFLIEGNSALLYADYETKESEKDYVLSFGGKGGLTSFHQTVNSPMTLRSAAVSNEASFSEESDKMLFQTSNNISNISDMEHDQPVSFGVTVSKLIVPNLSIETGLIYSYLYSKSKNMSSVIQKHETQSLHYIGVPLNLNYNLFSIRDLNLYVSFGGMIEKDVYGKFREEGEGQSLDDQNKSEVLKNETISQKRPQLSVNTGLGLSYPLYRDLKLYGKIGGAYYFDANNEYKTIYSDRKIVMDLSLGIRYEF